MLDLQFENTAAIILFVCLQQQRFFFLVAEKRNNEERRLKRKLNTVISIHCSESIEESSPCGFALHLSH